MAESNLHRNGLFGEGAEGKEQSTLLRVHLALLMAVARDLGGLNGLLTLQPIEYGQREIEKQYRDLLVDALKGAEAAVAEIPASHLLKTKVSRAVRRAEGDFMTYAMAHALVRDILEDLIIESQAPVFLMIPVEWAGWYQDAMAPFGGGVERAFPEAKRDIAAAARCMALGEHTAAVFHLMRAGEHALRKLAAELGVQNVEAEDWARLIARAKTKLDAIRQLPRATPERHQEIQYYANALASLDLFKDAWRNPVSHSRSHFELPGAMDVWNGVRAFMQTLASPSRAG